MVLKRICEPYVQETAATGSTENVKMSPSFKLVSSISKLLDYDSSKVIGSPGLVTTSVVVDALPAIVKANAAITSVNNFFIDNWFLIRK